MVNWKTCRNKKRFKNVRLAIVASARNRVCVIHAVVTRKDPERQNVKNALICSGGTQDINQDNLTNKQRDFSGRLGIVRCLKCRKVVALSVVSLVKRLVARLPKITIIKQAKYAVFCVLSVISVWGTSRIQSSHSHRRLPTYNALRRDSMSKDKTSVENWKPTRQHRLFDAWSIGAEAFKHLHTLKTTYTEEEVEEVIANLYKAHPTLTRWLARRLNAVTAVRESES